MKQRNIACLVAVCLLSACSDKPDKPPYAGIKIGKPYQIYGRWYKPKYEPDYDEIGTASWYGPGFHGNSTANGERYDQHDLTAAHRTLPLPSIVRVTNLENGKSALLKVNDRGPFAKDRIIDLSKASATALGVIGKGTARVRVQFLERETKDYVTNSNGQGMSYAMNKLKDVNPMEAGQVQEIKTTPQFYVMKVPSGQKPPPTAVAVSEEEAVKYPTRNIFEAVDTEQAANDNLESSGSIEPSITTASFVTNKQSAQLGSGAYYIQAGTFGQEENAQKLASRLADYDTQVLDMDSGKRKLYRVVVGPYDKAGQAKNMLSKLTSLGISGARIVRD